MNSENKLKCSIFRKKKMNYVRLACQLNLIKSKNFYELKVQLYSIGYFQTIGDLPREIII